METQVQISWAINYLPTRRNRCPFPPRSWKSCARKRRKFSGRFLALHNLAWLYLKIISFATLPYSLEYSTCHPLHWQSLWQSWSTSKTSGISVSLTSRMSTLGSWLGKYSEKVSFFSTLWGQPPEATQSSFPILNRIAPPGQPAPNIFVLTKGFLCVASFILCQMRQPMYKSCRFKCKVNFLNFSLLVTNVPSLSKMPCNVDFCNFFEGLWYSDLYVYEQGHDHKEMKLVESEKSCCSPVNSCSDVTSFSFPPRLVALLQQLVICLHSIQLQRVT